jgi:hypothetical protein
MNTIIDCRRKVKMSSEGVAEAEGKVAEVEPEVDPELLAEIDEIDDVIPAKPVEDLESKPEPEEKEEKEEEEKGEQEEKDAEGQKDEEGTEKEEDKGEGEAVERDEEAEVEVEGEKEVEEPAKDDTTRDAVIEEMRRQNEQLQAMVKDLASGKKEEAAEEKPAEGDVEVKLDKFDFFEGVEFNEDMYDPAKLKELLNDGYNKVYKASVEQSVRRVPGLVESLISDVMSVRQAVNEFYDTNPDLREHSVEVQRVADFVANENPNMPLGEMLTEAARRFRMYKGMPVDSGRDNTPPTSPKKPTARRTKTVSKKEESPKIPKATQELYDEMDELDEE